MGPAKTTTESADSREGDAERVVLRAQATQQVQGRRVEPIGDGLDLSRWGSSP
jgi:hypothetical protein